MGAARKRRNPAIRLIGIKNLILDEAIQSRQRLDLDWVHELSEFRRDGAEFPPIGVIQTEDGRFYVWSGFHRVHASQKAGDTQVRCEVKVGTLRDARILSAGSNKGNGSKPMGKKDLKRAAYIVFEDDEWRAKSSVVLGEYLGISTSAARAWRNSFCKEKGIPIPDEVVRKDGKSRHSATRRSPLDYDAPPRIHKKKNGSYDMSFMGRLFYLGMDKEKAEQKRDEIFSAAREEQRKNLASLSAGAIVQRLVHHQISAKVSGNWSGCGIGSVIIAGDCIAVAGDLSVDLSRLETLVGRLLLNRVHHAHSGRLVIICHGVRQGSGVDVARAMGIEFMTPEELIESLK